ncbi:dihydrolipoyl dehydrogenase family protein [Massilia horti]|uniref:NAD(P)/FAD-dependent oxidoreductase n=1 Tax=Massilia horti TaxID=2562153 RepID=A0A4Y9SVX2_9BURK|nr:NAD(P)/FAD-dependent oxidoreductase [Massilia horti]TFW30751.1 NAD(P)/FAD-dependent oxidoreductase [Massilia horti]
MHKQFHLLVVGTGTAATVAAWRARDAGWSVAVIDYRRFGGTCALRGCDPKRVLVDAAAAYDDAKRRHGKGLAGEVRLDWQVLMNFKRTFTDPVPEKREALYADKGIAAFHGHARFTGANVIDVDGDTLEGRYILIAAGAEPANLGIPGEQYLVTSETLLTLDLLPHRILIVGGGFIAAEFSHVAARGGAQVTIVGESDRMLSEFAAETVDWLMPAFDAAGIEVHTGTAVEAIEQRDGAYLVRASKDGKPLQFNADLVVHAAGRKPDLQALGVEAAGIELEHGRLRLSGYLQSVSNPAVYAAGDAASMGPQLTPVATYDAKVAIDNILKGNHRTVDYSVVPSVAFTIPPIATVGLDEQEANDKQLKFRVCCANAADWFTARRSAQPVYGYKILVEEDSGRILGAHLVGPNVDELINLFALAIRHGLSADALKETLFAYPTGASDIGSMLG